MSPLRSSSKIGTLPLFQAMPRYTDDRGDRPERRREDHHSSRHYRGESPPRRSATERCSNEPHAYGDRSIPPFRANTSSRARPRVYSFETSNSGYRDTPPGMTRSYTTNSRPNNRPRSPSPEYVYVEPSQSRRSGPNDFFTFSSPVYEEPPEFQSRPPRSKDYHTSPSPEYVYVEPAQGRRSRTSDSFTFSSPVYEEPPEFQNRRSRTKDYPTSPSPEYVYAEPSQSSGRNEYPTCASPVYEEPSDNQGRRTNSWQQSSHSNTDSADDPTRGIDMNVVALIFVGIAFTFAQARDLQQKILHMVNFLEYYEVYLSEKEVEDIFHYMYNEREKAKKRFAIPDKDRIKEFEQVTGLRKYWVLEGHRRCRTH